MAGSSSRSAFEWGNKEAGSESSYESMCLDGVWYNLHDCVFCRSGMKKPFVGKLMRLFEDENGARKVRIRWFFRAYELPVSVIKDFTGDIRSSNELFIALGNVKGVENENPVEVIRGKAMVLCTARYGENMIPSRPQMDAADFVFSRAYDVSNQKVVKMGNILNKQLVQKFVNKSEWMILVEDVGVEESKSTTSSGNSKSANNVCVVATKRHLMRTSSIDSSVSQHKKLKEKEKQTYDQVEEVE